MCYKLGPPDPASADKAPKDTYFTCRKLTKNLFYITEDDKWGENPFIYVRLYASTVVLIDTGCGGPHNSSDADFTSLRHFIEEYSVADNDSQPLNPGGAKNYTVICTHCHYDHIGGIMHFTESSTTSVVASSYDKDFIAGPDRLPTSSLCRFVGMNTPKYTVTVWAEDGQSITDSAGNDLGLVLYHAPGHTPDQLAIWDAQERFLFVGDTVYEHAPILFPIEGNIKNYVATIKRLQGLVKGWNSTESQSRVLMACGHLTCNADAGELLEEVRACLQQSLVGTIQPKPCELERGEDLESYTSADKRVSFQGPRSYFVKARADQDLMSELT
ncbi:hypothetical protein FOVSG1_004241 [Fusarium oxysporum f. sp. vasinfectum]